MCAIGGGSICQHLISRVASWILETSSTSLPISWLPTVLGLLPMMAILLCNLKLRDVCVHLLRIPWTLLRTTFVEVFLHANREPMITNEHPYLRHWWKSRVRCLGVHGSWFLPEQDIDTSKRVLVVTSISEDPGTLPLPSHQQILGMALPLDMAPHSTLGLSLIGFAGSCA